MLPMKFIHIATLADAEDFIGWLDSSRKLELKDSIEFSEWLESQMVFPVEFYLDGMTYRFDNRRALDFFKIGFEAALRMRLNG
jgi:hypothetical protein